MVTGLNTPSFKRVRKNYIPPFEDKGWKVVGDASLIGDVVKNGYEVSYKAINSKYMGLSYDLPLSLAGKTVSISVQEARGSGSAIQLSWRLGGVLTNKSIAFSNGNKMEGIAIPSGITTLYFKIQNNDTTSETYYFKGLQLEEGVVSTDFEEKIEDGAESLYELAPKKNIFNGNQEIGNIDGNGVNISGENVRSINFTPVKPSTQYTFSISGKSNPNPRLYFFDKNFTHISNALGATQTSPSNARYMKWHNGATSIDDLIQIEEGAYETPYEPYELVWKPKRSRFVPKKNMLFSQHSNPQFLNGGVGSSNRVATVLRDGGFVNSKYYELSIDPQTVTDNYYVLHGDLPVNVFKLYKLKPNTTYTLSSYIKTDGSGVLGFIKGILFNKQGTVYSGEKLGNSVTSTSWTRSSVTFTTDSNVSGVLVRLQVPVTNLAGKVSFDGLQLEEGELTAFQPYVSANKKVTPVPQKNYLLPFTQWIADNPANVSVKFLEQTKNRLVVELNNINAYAGVSMPINMDVFNNLRGRTVTLSTMKFDRSQSNSQIQLRFYGGSTGNTDFVLSGTNSTTKVIPLDFTSVFMRVQSNQVGYTKIEIEDLQLEIGERTGYAPYQLGNPVSSIKKAPYRKYSFEYQRQGAEVLDGVQYGTNNPRFKNGGLFIEEGTTNLFGSKNISSNNGTTMMDLGDRIRFTGQTDGNSTGGYITSIVVKPSTTYTISAKFVEGDSATGKLNYLAEQSGLATIRRRPVKLGDRYYMTFTTDASATRVNICFYLNGAITGDYFDIYKDWQIEEKGYPTSPTVGSRKIDKVYVNNVEKLIDTAGGSIKIKFDYEDLAIAKISSGFLFDNWNNGTGRWFSNYDANLQKFQVSLNGLGLLQFPSTVLEAKNEVLIEWLGKALTVTVNGTSLTGSNGTGGYVYTGYLSIGQRFSFDNAWLNASIQEFTIKDRDGKITFQL